MAITSKKKIVTAAAKAVFTDMAYPQSYPAPNINVLILILFYVVRRC